MHFTDKDSKSLYLIKSKRLNDGPPKMQQASIN